MTKEKRIVIDGMSMSKQEAYDYKTRLARREVFQLFCDHEHKKRTMYEGSNELIECLDCGKWWHD